MTDRRPETPTGAALVRLVKAFRFRYAVNIVAWTVIWSMPVIPALITKAFFDSLELGPAGSNVGTLIALMAAYGVARVTVMVLAMWNDVHFMYRTGSLMRRNMMERIYELPGAQSVHESPGEMITRFREDVEHTEEALSWTVDMSGAFFFSVIAIGLLLSIDARITLLVFSPLVVIIVIAERAGTKIRRYRIQAREATGEITGMLGEVLGSVQSIKVAGAERSVISRFASLNHKRRTAMVKDRVLTAMLESVFWNTLNVGTGLILILAASSLSAGTLTIGEFALFVYFLDFITDSVYFIGLFIARYKQAGVSIDRMVELMRGSPPPELTKPRDLQLTGAFAPPTIDGGGSTDPLHRLEVRGLTFVYPGTDRGIHDIELTIERGSFTVVTGRIGSGKTTLLRALLGLVEPDGGEVRWNGRLVTHPGTFFVPPRSAYTPQVPTLFSMSLRDNLLMGLDPGNGEGVSSAITAAALDRDMESMGDGLDTLVGPLGMRLSGGQIQRAAAARMFVRRPELLVFDDLSSALDVETEQTLWQRLFADQRHATALVVSHRRPALQRADQIVVMSNGRVQAIGDAESLLAESSAFRYLWAGDTSARGPS